MKTYSNFVILSNGSLIKLKSLKKKYKNELLNDNYNINYLSKFKLKKQNNYVKNLNINSFLKKYK